jgi:acyl-coenzyme A synthetase/AMP-(fatty) acid ligase
LIIPVIPFAVEERVGVARQNAQSAISVLLAAYAAGAIIASPFIGWIAGDP